MSETSHLEVLDPFIIGNNEDPKGGHRQYDLYAPTGYLEFTDCLARQRIGEVLQEDSPLKILRLGFPVDPKNLPVDKLPTDVNRDTDLLLRDSGAVVCDETGPKLVHVTRDDLLIGLTPIRTAGGAFYLHGYTDEGRIGYSKPKDREAAGATIIAIAKDREALKAEAANDIAGHVIEDLVQQIAVRKNETSWLFNNEEIFPVAIPEKWQRKIGFEPFGRTLREVIPEEIIDLGLNAIQREGVLKRIAWIDDLFAQAAKLIKAYLAKNLDVLLGDISQRRRLALQHGIGAQDVPLAGVSFAAPPVSLNIHYLPYVTVLPQDRLQEAVEQFRKDTGSRIEKFLQTKDSYSKVVDIFNI